MKGQQLQRSAARRAWLRGAGSACAALWLGGCERSRAQPPALRVWAHQGQEGENAALRRIGQAFSLAHPESPVELSFFPDNHYTERLSIAAAAEDLPDAFELDGPLVARFVDAARLAPLDEHFTPAEQADFLPTIRDQGTVAGRLYTLGAYDSATVLYCDREWLDDAGVAYTHGGPGFSWPELIEACARLKARGRRPLALHTGESSDEWFTYAFTPLIWSGGGELIDPRPGGGVRGLLASAANVATVKAWQQLFTSGFAIPDPVEPDPFGNGKAAMDWSGHWMARSHLERKGAALGVMGLPHFGRPVAACGSFCWALSSDARRREPAIRWLRWVTDPEHGVGPLVRSNGAVPARLSAFAAFPEYERLPYALFRRQLETLARARPRTPFYATLTQKFAAALRDIAHGADVAARLRRAEDDVQGFIDRWRGALEVSG